jgi:L-alanine-DL-glutamate epimerase-like enolase superfamily enzyme
MKRAASLWGNHIDADDHGDIAVPQGPGLGYEPDPKVMEKYRVS